MNPEPDRYPELKFLSEFSEIENFKNRLPHWHLNRATVFVTFRLGDSIPAKLLTEWKCERDEWLLLHPKPWSAGTETEYHKRFSSRIDHLMDEGHGSCCLAHSEYAEIVSDTLARRDGEEYLLHTWVIMPNHLHLLLSLAEEATLSKVVAAWKKFSAIRIHKRMGASGPLWQKDYFDRIIRDWDHFRNVACYIRRNPQKTKLKPENHTTYEAPWIKRLLS